MNWQPLRLLSLCISIGLFLFAVVRCLIEMRETGSAPFDAIFAAGTALLLLLGYLAMPHDAKKVVSEHVIAQHDIDLFRDFQAALPFDPTIRTLRDTDFGADYVSQWLEPLNVFVAEWDDTNKEFLDPTIESERKALYLAAKELAFDFARETVPHDGNPGWRTVYPWNHRDQPRSKAVIESARILNESSRKFVPIHDKFVRLARKRLAQPAQ